jgi:hypothetical protein
MDSQTKNAELAYREAFERFSKNVQQVQQFIASSQAEKQIAEAALVELQKAYLDYERARDAYARRLLSPSDRAATPARGEHHNPNAVRVIAELLWETAGRPEGTADEDWHRAEEIVRKAAAA